METERDSATLFRLFVESVTDYAIFMLDTAGYVVSWNPGARRIKGYEAREILGQHFSVFYTQEDRDRGHPWHELDLARADGRYSEEGWRVRKDGGIFPAHVVITAVRDESGELVGFGKVTRDLTERRLHEERETDLERERMARIEAGAANRAKAQFLTTMSHELRTPLNAIIGYIDLIEFGVQGPLTAAQASSLKRVRRSAQLLLSMINDLLNFARIEAGRIELALEDISADLVVDDVTAVLAPQFAARSIAFERTGCGAAVEVRADPDRVQQILLNLLVNALKFTDEGGRIALRCEATGEHVRLVVTDTGRGIPADKASSIFEPFVQLDRHLVSTSNQGVGLGLAISRDLARAMGGDIELRSQVGVGSTFTLVLPRAR
jgi:PAS domain S-box-containing protein